MSQDYSCGSCDQSFIAHHCYVRLPPTSVSLILFFLLSLPPLPPSPSLPPLPPSPSISQPLVKEAEVKLIDMIHQMLSDGNLKFAQLLRNALVEKVNKIYLHIRNLNDVRHCILLL